MKLYHGTNCSSAMNIVNNGIDLKYSKPYLDFGAGFYTTTSYDHAARLAIRVTNKYNSRYKKNELPYIVEVDFKFSKDIELSTTTYPHNSKKWGEFVLNNRLTPEILMKYSITEHNQDARYDVCVGEIADGSITNIAYEVNSGRIMPDEVDYKKFLRDNGEVYSQQYSFHTSKAVSCIKVLSCGTIKNINKYSKVMRGR
ncbi:MAG: DUF3990 domain-containing protein [Lachnospiraceae bacterium]|nr:DUF3990 domain-containing protein [Lachnospiraceae bacterium]